MALNFAKLEKFEGVDFKRWQKKMHFLLSSMSVVYVLTAPVPEDGDENPTIDQIRKRAKWDNDDYVSSGLILNGMFDFLFDVYQNIKTSKELWDTLEAKYMAKDASSMKFFVSNFTNYKMNDSKPVLEQYNELLGILGRAQDNDKPKGNNVASPSVVNMVEHNNSSRYNNKGKCKHHDTRANPKKKPKVTCWKCRKPGHLKKDCKSGNDDDVAWWVDSGATMHVCKGRCWFKTYESLNDGSFLHIGNESTALVHGRGCVDLRFYVVKPNDLVETNSIIESRDAIFDENRTSKDFGHEFKLYLIEVTRDEVSNQHSYCFNVEDDPKTFDEAMKSQDVAFSKEAINDEMDSIMGNNI
nr:zinc finger, CCHC-type [Tanacetum cinerariifolium]